MKGMSNSEKNNNSIWAFTASILSKWWWATVTSQTMGMEGNCRILQLQRVSGHTDILRRLQCSHFFCIYKLIVLLPSVIGREGKRRFPICCRWDHPEGHWIAAGSEDRRDRTLRFGRKRDLHCRISRVMLLCIRFPSTKGPNLSFNF